MTNTEIEVLKVMAGKDISWTWMILDRALATRGIPGFSSVPAIVDSLVEAGFVSEVYDEDIKKPKFSVTLDGKEFLRQLK